MKNWKSILFAFLIFAALSTMEAKAQDVAPALTGKEVTLLLRDSDNAHKVAKVALSAVDCMLQSLSGNAEWTPQECVERLTVILKDYGQEHLILHPMVIRMLKAKLDQRSS